ncbi:sialate O-acetylesterase [Hymenobacter jeollabukensis]|uniref:sialate O-acetylesterase n=1 Tax=Hymenobacter jeollabukensis TaxID=2025313 RepID=UPI001FEC031C|nr:sialate O-acetylesterase [Hymenobacter jeollabukensis]
MKTPLLPAIAALALVASLPASAAVRLPRLVGDHMVLQRGQPLPLWGWADAGEAVTVTWRGQTYAAKTGGPNGRWTVTLPATPAGGPYELTVQGQNQLTVRDVLVGDVWLASGQSNMEWPVRDALNAPAEIAAANFPRIRRIDVPNEAALTPQPDFGGAGWQPCTPETVGSFSAVAYFFARELQQQYQVPIGLITAEWGGTPAEAWTSAESLRRLPDFAERVGAVQALKGSIPSLQADFDARTKAWQASPAGQDQGLQGGQARWADPAFDAQTWPTMTLPGYWESQTEALRDFDGIVWLRRAFTLTAADAAQPATVGLARIDDRDSTWVNGVAVGGTRGYYPQRRYPVPAGLLRPGRNVVTVRVVDDGGGGGIWGAGADMYLALPTRRLPLDGPWQYHVAYEPATQPRAPFPGGPQMTPTVLFNGLINPLVPYALKGVIWYQGETNAPRAAQYRTLFPALIRDWRAQWQRPELPFLFVQIAGYQPNGNLPAESTFSELREAQQLVLALPATGMATAIDVGDSTDIHPRDKQTVGRRLALQARRVAYGEAGTVASGPVFDKMTISGNTVRLTFKNAGHDLVLKDAGGPYLKGFALAGADRRFVWAQGEVQGSSIVLRSPAVPKPVAVRYAWGNMPFLNLYNREGLPAPPFRTDQWPGLTTGKK